MSARKSYVRPAVLTEDLLEQTSLACNATAAWATHAAGGNFGPGPENNPCALDVSKNGAFANDLFCETVLTGPGEVVALS